MAYPGQQWASQHYNNQYSSNNGAPPPPLGGWQPTAPGPPQQWNHGQQYAQNQGNYPGNI